MLPVYSCEGKHYQHTLNVNQLVISELILSEVAYNVLLGGMLKLVCSLSISYYRLFAPATGSNTERINQNQLRNTHMGKLLTIVFLLFGTAQANAQKIFSLIQRKNIPSIQAYKGDVNCFYTGKELDKTMPPEIEEMNLTALGWAVYVSDLNIVKQLIKKGAKPKMSAGGVKSKSPGEYITLQNKFGEGQGLGSCMSIAAATNKVDILKYFIEDLKVDVDEPEYSVTTRKFDGYSALQSAATNSSIEAIDYLLSKGAKINLQVYPIGETALTLAINRKFENVVAVLIEKGADVNLGPFFPVSPLFMAIQTGSRKIAKLLYSKGAKIVSEERSGLKEALMNNYGISTLEEL